MLEIGCGAGANAIGFVAAGAEYTGVDISAGSLDEARSLLARHGLDAGFVQADLDELPLHVRAASFDLVCAFGLLDVLADPGRAIRQARRAVRADGCFKAIVQAQNSWEHCMVEAGLAVSERPWARAYAAAELRALLREHDFAATTIRQAHLATAGEDGMTLPWFAAMPPAMREAFAGRFGAHLTVCATPA